MTHRSLTRPTRVAVALAMGLVAVSAAHAQTWEYKSYKKVGGRGGTFDREKFNLGEITLEEKDGKAVVRQIVGTVDACLRGEIPALVTRTDATITIELQQISGCEPTRYVIRTDGSGGIREMKRNDRWVNDTFDHGLTLKK
jgi:hypothetical protein